ncbi:hypothetical protein GCM10009715_22660 [Paeniglutamicibacter psychrophenolicus]|uniref:Tetratricopeptide repeat protein n=1 Tax=Paeniglutamicibacter psychrophenolicus TaxID=257454 RepID=A0ABS4WI60_9MICC|nr:hypothetical protein [Paeniglutamicibacter psychrophenolicus]MBP2375701.1 hypothetical protein [Paeniglutamicibacter psychrophenolicus]
MIDWTTITAAISVALGGDSERGQELLMDCWNATVPADHAHRCILAHYLADTQSQLDKEVAWDQAALDEHGFLADDALAPLGIASAQGLQPSLQLNLADGYHRQGRTALAREHLDQGLAHADALDNDGYGKLILAGLNNLAQRIDASDPA